MYVQMQCIATISAFNHRDALPALRELLVTSTNINVLRPIVQVLQAWNDTASAPYLLEQLDLTMDTALTNMIIQILKQMNFRDALPKIKEMIPLSGVDKAKALENGIKDWQ